MKIKLNKFYVNSPYFSYIYMAKNAYEAAKTAVYVNKDAHQYSHNDKVYVDERGFRGVDSNAEFVFRITDVIADIEVDEQYSKEENDENF
jgi:hypothetical protein